MVMKYDPNASESDTSSSLIDINVLIAAEKSTPMTIFEGTKKNFRNASGKVGELQLPAAAPLVFPDLDVIGEKRKQTNLKTITKFTTDYFDRRAQANFVSLRRDYRWCGYEYR